VVLRLVFVEQALDDVAVHVVGGKHSERFGPVHFVIILSSLVQMF
jgi:hypothetical protein